MREHFLERESRRDAKIARIVSRYLAYAHEYYPLCRRPFDQEAVDLAVRRAKTLLAAHPNTKPTRTFFRASMVWAIEEWALRELPQQLESKLWNVLYRRATLEASRRIGAFFTYVLGPSPDCAEFSTGQNSQACEIASFALAKFYRSLPNYRHEENLHGWLSRIVKQETGAYLKRIVRERSRANQTVSWDQLGHADEESDQGVRSREPADPTPDPAECIVAQEATRMLNDFFAWWCATASTRDREILRFWWFERKSPVEIATILGLRDRRQVDTALCRFRKKMRMYLTEHYS